MSKKKKSANPSAGKQSREQLLNQQKNGAAAKEEVKVPGKSMMEIMREKREAMFGSLAKPVAQPVAPPPIPKPASAPATRAETATQVPAVNGATSSAPNPASHVSSPCFLHPTGVASGGPNAPTAPGTLPSPNGPIKAPAKINTWMEVFKMTPADRQAWFAAIPGAETTFNMIIENAKRKHALVAADKAKAQGTSTWAFAEPGRTPQGTTSNAPGPSRAPLPPFASPIGYLTVPAGLTTPQRPSSTPVSGSAPMNPLTAPSMATSVSANPQLARQPYHNPLNPHPVSGPNPPQNVAQEIEFLRAENEDMRSIMLDVQKATQAEMEKRGLLLSDATSRMGPHLAKHGPPPPLSIAGAQQQTLELENLQETLGKLSVETGKIKQENEQHLAELTTIRSDVESLRRENTRLGLETVKERLSRETLQSDKAKLEAEVMQLKQQLQQKDEKLIEAETEARRYRNEIDLTKRTIDRLKEIIQAGEKERRRIKIRLDAVKLLVLQDDLGDLSTLDLDGVAPVRTPVEQSEDALTPHIQQAPSLTPNSILLRPSPSRENSTASAVPADESASPSTATWSKDIKERARSKESVKLLKVAWKLAAMERIALPIPPVTPGTSAAASVTSSTPAEDREKTVTLNATDATNGDDSAASSSDLARVQPSETEKKELNGKIENKDTATPENKDKNIATPNIERGVEAPKMEASNGKNTESGDKAEVAPVLPSPAVQRSSIVTAKEHAVQLHASASSTPKDSTRPVSPMPHSYRKASKTLQPEPTASVTGASGRSPYSQPVQSFPPSPTHPLVLDQLFAALPGMIQEAAMGNIAELHLTALRTLLAVRRPEILRWNEERNLPSPYLDLPAILRPGSNILPVWPSPPANHASLVPDASDLPNEQSTSSLDSAKKDSNADGEESVSQPIPEIHAAPQPAVNALKADGKEVSPSLKEPSTTGSVPACSIFTARSRKIRARKTHIASRVMVQLLRAKRLAQTAVKDTLSSPGSSEYGMDTTSEAQSMSVGSEQIDSSGSTSDAGTSDVSDLQLDSRNKLRDLKAIPKKSTRVTIMDLPDELVEDIAWYLRPEYKPKEEIYRDLRVVMWEQDDIFSPSWGKDLFGLATTCKRFRALLYDRNRLKCVQVVDSEEGLESMVKNIPRNKKDLVKAVIIGNNLRVDEGVHAPNYLYFLEAFPNLKAIQHRPFCDLDSPKMTAAPFGFTPLDSLDISVPDLLCEANLAPPKNWPPTQVKSLTLRESDWWMLYSDVTVGPGGGKCKAYFNHLCKYFKGVKQLNLFPVLIGDRYTVPNHEVVGEQTKTWITKSNLPEVETINIRFDAVHKFRKEGLCALPRIEFILTKYSPTLRHVKITVDLIDRFVTEAFLESLGPRQPDYPYWYVISNYYLPTPARIQEFARTLAKHIPALETVQFLIYDYDTRALPLFDYQCDVVRVKKSEPGKPGSFRLQESTMNRLHKHTIY